MKKFNDFKFFAVSFLRLLLALKIASSPLANEREHEVIRKYEMYVSISFPRWICIRIDECMYVCMFGDISICI